MYSSIQIETTQVYLLLQRTVKLQLYSSEHEFQEYIVQIHSLIQFSHLL